ncbi:MAG: hypothetical protein FK733_02265 [Asgard group archaeon]|nr:hypothetical protein [Asgard group archaeon]
MTEEKKKVGRPRKYETRAERQKAYHERKKQRLKELEEQVQKMEKDDIHSIDVSSDLFDDVTFKKTSKISWRKITPSEIALMGTQELDTLVTTLKGDIRESFSLSNSLENIVLGIISKHHHESKSDVSNKDINNIKSNLIDNYDHLESSIQQQTLLYLMEAELASRQRLDSKKTKLDIFEAKIDELETKAKKKELTIEEKQKAK